MMAMMIMAKLSALFLTANSFPVFPRAAHLLSGGKALGKRESYKFSIKKEGHQPLGVAISNACARLHHMERVTVMDISLVLLGLISMA